MALVKCAECGNEVSTSATSCPKCGAPGPAAAAMQQGVKRFKGHLLGALITLGIGMVVWMVMMTSGSTDELSATITTILCMGGSLWGVVTVFRMMRPHS